MRAHHTWISSDFLMLVASCCSLGSAPGHLNSSNTRVASETWSTYLQISRSAWPQTQFCLGPHHLRSAGLLEDPTTTNEAVLHQLVFQLTRRCSNSRVPDHVWSFSSSSPSSVHSFAESSLRSEPHGRRHVEVPAHGGSTSLPFADLWVVICPPPHTSGSSLV